MEKVILSVLQPVYLPWLGYFEQIAYADHFVFYDNVQYTKQDWRNRNKILTKNGPIWITVPVVKSSLHTPINKIRINNRINWKKKHLESIKQNYSKAPYFQDFFPTLESIILREWIHLSDLDIELIKTILQHLDIKTDTSLFSNTTLQSEGGYHNSLRCQREKASNKNFRLLEICKYHNAKILYEGASGSNYIDLDLFNKNGIDVVFQNYIHKPYTQQSTVFYPYISIIDLLMNEGSNAKNILLSSPIDDKLRLASPR